VDELTRERFWARATPPPLDWAEREVIAARQRVLLGIAETEDQAGKMQAARLRAEALVRSRRLSRAIRTYSVRSA
jgi:hypothetical protein